MTAADFQRPAGLQTDGLRLEPIGDGMSGALVLRVAGVSRIMVAKIAGSVAGAPEIAREGAVLEWLAGRFGAPKLIWRGDLGSRSAVLMEAIEGTPLHALSQDEVAASVAAALAALKRLHAEPIQSCPFDQRLLVKLAEARRRVFAGEADAADLEPENGGRTAASILAELESATPPHEDLVVCHGDACWPNFILAADQTVGIVDLGRFGVADRHQDLALFLRSAAHNFPLFDWPRLVEAGYGPLDPEKLRYYRLLDELF
jgi:aminoglycoside phosphotransferase